MEPRHGDNTAVIDYRNSESNAVPAVTLRLLAEIGFEQISPTERQSMWDKQCDDVFSLWYCKAEHYYIELYGNRVREDGDAFGHFLAGQVDDLLPYLRLRDFPVDRILRTKRLRALIE